jgi:hypothetical protein
MPHPLTVPDVPLEAGEGIAMRRLGLLCLTTRVGVRRPVGGS